MDVRDAAEVGAVMQAIRQRDGGIGKPGQGKGLEHEEQRPMMPLRDLMMVLCVVTVWGASFTVIKLGLGDMPPMLMGR